MLSDYINDINMLEQRITELEIKISYQDEITESLSKVIAEQQRQIGRLEETCKLLHDKITALSADQGGSNAGIEIPPHY